MLLSPAEQTTLLSAARLTLQTYVKTDRMPDLELTAPGLLQPRGAFVTLEVGGRLRGSVGLLQESGPLYKTVMNLVATASREDERFPPIEAGELHQVRIGLSILSAMEPLGGIDQIEVGRTGLAYLGEPPEVFVPQTLVENNWNAQQFLDAFCQSVGKSAEDLQTSGGLFTFTTEEIGEDGGVGDGAGARADDSRGRRLGAALPAAT